jgi:hypothetical protein
MKNRIFHIKYFSILVILIAMSACFFYADSSPAAGPSFLADRHKKGGIDCEGCHPEKPPGKLVPMQVCLGCHGGEYAKLAEQTKKVTPNPHDSHLGAAACEFCHHAHKPSEYYCANCHMLDSKVP